MRRPDHRAPGSPATSPGASRSRGDEQRRRPPGRSPISAGISSGSADDRADQVAGAGLDGDRRHERPDHRQGDVAEHQDQRSAPGSAAPSGGPSSSSANAGTAITSSTTRKMNSAARLGHQQRRAVDRGQQERVEAALLALGDEQAVDPQHRREQQRHRQHARRQLAVDRVRFSPKWKITNVAIENSTIAGSVSSLRSSSSRSLRRTRQRGLHAYSSASFSASSRPGSPTNAGRPCLRPRTRSASASAACGSWLVSTRVARSRVRSAARPARRRPDRGSPGARRAAAAWARAAPRGRRPAAAPSRGAASAPGRRRGRSIPTASSTSSTRSGATPCSRAW